MEKKGILTITLKSDLCIGSGLSYAGIIDQDVVYDENGFPYIPARRIKGCLREAAELVAEESLVNQLLGQAGQETPGLIYIENAQISNIEDFRKDVRNCRDTKLKRHLGTEDILGLYTTVRAQTAIEDATGIAKDNTLRMVRVVNQYDPLTSGHKVPLCFEARISYGEKNAQETEKFLKNAARAMRHIGMNRNRGLGNVRCDFQVCKNPNNRTEGKSVREMLRTESCDGMVRIAYELENTQPLMLSDVDKDNSISYISGKSVIGVLAAAYIREKKKQGIEDPAEAEEFADLFLNGKVKYRNANPSLDGKRTVPAPLYLNRLKKTKKLVNMLSDSKDKEEVRKKYKEYDWENGNQPKKLKTEYVRIDPSSGKIENTLLEPEREMSFHHRHAHGEGAPEAILYSHESLASGQCFAGVIEAPKEYEELLLELFECANFRFGKSKNAQYGSCRLIPCEEDCFGVGYLYKKGDVVVVTLLSDAIFINDNSSLTVRFDEVKDLIARSLGIKESKAASEENETKAEWLQEQANKSIVQTTTVTGYNTKWNRKRDAASAIKAGSAFVYVLGEDWYRGGDSLWVGERNQEGYGEVMITSINQVHYNVEDEDNVQPGVVSGDDIAERENGDSFAAVWQGNENLHEIIEEDEVMLSEEMQEALCQILYPKLVRALMEKELSSSVVNKLSASAIGRVTLMMKECAADYSDRDSAEDNDKLACELMRRIDSIKDKTKRTEAKKLVLYVDEISTAGSNGTGEEDKNEDKEKDYLINTSEMAENDAWSGLELAYFLKNSRYLTEERKQALLKKVWREWMLEKLALLKYRKKGE